MTQPTPDLTADPFKPTPDPRCPEGCPDCAALPWQRTIRVEQHNAVRAAMRAEEVFDRVTTTVKFTDAERETNLMAHGAMVYGYALASVLGLLVERSPELAHEAVEMVQDMAANGGVWHIEGLCAEVAAEIAAKAAEVKPVPAVVMPPDAAEEYVAQRAAGRDPVESAARALIPGLRDL